VNGGSGFWTQVREVAAKDLRREARTGEVAWVTIPFGALALLLIPLAVGTDIPTLRKLGPGLFWVVVLLFGVLVAVRRSAGEDRALRDTYALLGLDPAAKFVGHVASSGLFLLGFQAVVGLVAVVLYDSGVTGWPWLFLVFPLAATGLALLGTLTGSIAASLKGGNALVPLLVAPLAVPLLLAATQAWEGLRLGHTIVGWILLMVAVDLTLSVVGVLSARALEEAAR
jgi:heme exporter protein B